LLDLEIDANEEGGRCIVNSFINKTIELISAKSISLDILRMNNSSSMHCYKSIRTHHILDEFLEYKCSWSRTKCMVQLRSNLSQLSAENITIRLQTLCHFYKNEISPLCLCCNMKQPENLYHVLFVCPRYNLLRNKYLSAYRYPSSENEYCNFFNDISLEKMNKIYAYIKFTLYTRKLVVE
jgi:hypothetical protein